MTLCFDIGGTAIKVAEATSPGATFVTARVPTPTQDFDVFVAVLRGAILQASTPPTVLAFSLAGVIDPDTGRATVANIPCLTGRHLQSELEVALGLQVVLANDANCFALA